MRLPPRGSAQDELLHVLHRRDREKKFTEVAVLTGLLAPLNPLREKLLQIYREELFEDSYRPAILRARAAEGRKKQRETVDHQRLLEKAARMEAKGDIPTPTKGVKKQPGRR